MPPPPSPPSQDAGLLIDGLLRQLIGLVSATIALIGLLSIARCFLIRRLDHNLTFTSPPHSPSTTGIGRKTLDSFPIVSYSADRYGDKMIDCAICLTEFEDSDEVRVLPGCEHGFHVACVDRWLRGSSSCPSCRRLLVTEKQWCRKCGPTATAATVVAGLGEEAMSGFWVRSNVV